ncbi:hypothetical protein [Solobacterium moorei]|uniref:hypothetical protein n=1 Tax=Solobacterium moorei TaxID=102148 RepID=UPI0023F15628|nr:hypothetical protein [Solobacterium moorei]
MKFKVSKIISIVNEINKLNAISMPVKVAYRINANKRALAEACEPIQETINAVISKYSDSGKVTTDNPHYDECLKEINELNNEEVDVNIKMVKLSEIETLNMPLSSVEALSFMIEESEEDNELH